MPTLSADGGAFSLVMASNVIAFTRTPGETIREPVQIVEIIQPFCNLTFGTLPCTATGAKCYNTRATCRDPENFDKGSLSLYFSRGNVADRVNGLYTIPSLVSVSTAPTKINLTGANPDAQGLGTRALCTIQFKDHPHTDRVVDPYLSDRAFDPFERGSFWTKWIVRNKYRQGVQIKVYEGYEGQTLNEMQRRTYFLENVTGPDDSGNVTIQGKDILAKVEDRKAQAPAASPGELFADITSSATTFDIAGATEADYAASGTLRIDDELMTYTGRTDNGSGGITITGVTRGTDRTTAESHSAEAALQECLRYDDAPAVDVLEDLLTTWAGVDPAWLDTVNWQAEFDTYLQGYDLTTVISEPVAVQTLISEIQVQVGCFLWWDEVDALVKFKSVRGIEQEPPIVTDAANILSGMSIVNLPRERASQVWFYYAMRDYTQGVGEATNFERNFVYADLESEGADLYGEASIRKIYSRWLRSGAFAQTTASRIGGRYVDIPREVQFRMDAKDRGYGVGDTIQIQHFLDVDEFGDLSVNRWTIISMEEIQPGETVQYVAQDTTLYGSIVKIQEAGAADYSPGADEFIAFIGDADGLLSDGTNCARIA